MNSKDDISNSLEQLTISPKGCKIVSSNTNGTRTTLSLHFFDPGECVDKYLDEDGRIIQLLQSSECVSDIDMSETYEFQVSISDPQSETTHEPEHEHLKRVFKSLSTISSTLTGVSSVFYRTLWRLIDSDCFELNVFLTFLQEVAIFSELMLKNDGFANFSIIWSILQDLAIQQVTTFQLYMKTYDYADAHELLWLLEKVTNFQKEFLVKCVEETVEFKHLMGELARSWRTMLDIQEGFIVKLITRLQASKAKKTRQTSQISNAVEC